MDHVSPLPIYLEPNDLSWAPFWPWWSSQSPVSSFRLWAFWRKMLSCCFSSLTWKSSERDKCYISDLCLLSWIPSSWLWLLFTQHLVSSLVRSYSSETRRILFSTPLNNKLNWTSEKQNTFFTARIHVSGSHVGADARVEAEPCIVFLPVSLSVHSNQLWPSAVPCWHIEYGDAKNTDAQMEHAALHTFMTYVLT